MGTRQIRKQPLTFLGPPPWHCSGNGAGVTIAVLDSGFSHAHPALRKVRIADARSFTGYDPLTDPVGHGTECCGILVAHAVNGSPGGVAQGVRLCIGQILDPTGIGLVETLCEALVWAANLSVNIVAIPSGRMSDHPQLRQSIADLLAKGILIVAPVGNPYYGQSGPLYPAAYPEVISVGSQAHQEVYATWKQMPMVITAIHNFPLCTNTGGWRTAADTSQATMLVAGFACQLIETWQQAGKGKLTCKDLIATIGLSN